MSYKIQILNSKEVNQKIERLACEVYEHNFEEKEIIIVGIADRGSNLSIELAKHLKSISKMDIKLAKLFLDKDNPYEQDVKLNLTSSEYKDKVIILCDDVLNSGKTLMFATKHFLNQRIKKISTVVLIERNYNIYPIKADFVGLSLATTYQQYVKVNLDRRNKAVYLS